MESFGFNDHPEYRVLEILERRLLDLTDELTQETGVYKPLVKICLEPNLYDRLAQELVERSRRRGMFDLDPPSQTIFFQFRGGALEVTK